VRSIRARLEASTYVSLEPRKRSSITGTLPDTAQVAALELDLQIGLGYALIPTKGYTGSESLRAFTPAPRPCAGRR
jgi:hypothetical protein